MYPMCPMLFRRIEIGRYLLLRLRRSMKFGGLVSESPCILSDITFCFVLRHSPLSAIAFRVVRNEMSFMSARRYERRSTAQMTRLDRMTFDTDEARTRYQ